MTKEQAIKHLKLMQSGARNAIRFKKKEKEDIEIYQDQLEALSAAIKALEQQPSEDCVSRKAVLDCLTATGLKKFDFILDAREKVNNLPSVTPTHCIATVRFSKEDLREICNERIEIECTHGICKDCTKSKILNNFEGYSIVCSRFGRMAVNPDFYCADFESENK